MFFFCFMKIIHESAAPTFDGRLGRKQYIINALVLGFLSALVASMFSVFLDDGFSFNSPLYIIFQACVAAILLTYQVRRFHDIGVSGWFALLFIDDIVARFVPDSYFDAIYAHGILSPLALLVTIATACGVVAHLFLLFKKGTTGENVYGADPLAEVEEKEATAA